MKALGFYEHGEIDKIKLLEIAVPKPKSNEILLQVKASAFNHLDIWVRKGWPGLKLQLPHICGSDAAGIVTELGSEVRDLAIGDRVAINPGINLYEDEFTYRGEHSVSPGFRLLGEPLPGTHAEFITVPAKNALKIPAHISFELAAASGLVGVTAWRMLIHRAKICLGEKVLILGAGGGVNGMAIQIAKLAGCQVFAITGSEEKVKKAYTLGADVVLNYNENSNWASELFELSNHQGFDVVVDNVGSATFKPSLRLVKRGGRIVIVGNTSGPITELDIRYLFGKQISLIGSTMGNHGDYCQVMQLVFDKKLITPIYTVMPLSQGIEAMSMLEKHEQFGKIVLHP